MKRKTRINARIHPLDHNIKSVNTRPIFTRLNTVLLTARAVAVLSKEEIEAARRVIRKAVKKKGKVLVRSQAFFPQTRKPSETRMGKGKGKIKNYVVPVRPGKILFEIRGVTPSMAKAALLQAANKLRVPCGLINGKDAFISGAVLGVVDNDIQGD